MNEEESCDETTQGSGSPGFMTPREERSNMPVIHYPDPMDVLLGRGRGIQQHPGNRQYQELVDRSKEQYFNATSRHEKVHIAQQVVVMVMQTGRFLKYTTSLQGWIEVSEAIARQKVCQALQYIRRKTSVQEENMPGNDETATRFAHAHISVYQSDTESTSQTSSVPIHLTGPVEGKNHYSENPPEVKQGDDIDHDVEFMSVIRALSSEIHRRGSNDSL